MAIIALSGYSGSGKDSVGKIIQSLTETNIPDYKVFNGTEWVPMKGFSPWVIKKFAGKLKQIASLLTGIPIEKFEDQEFKKTYLGPEWDVLKMKPGKRQDGIFPKKVDMESVPMTVREFLQKLGTDAMRDGLHANTWVNALMADYKPTKLQWSDGPLGGYEEGPMPNWVITDCRFINEARAVKSKEGIVIRIDRSGVGPINNHPSEVELDNWNFDYKIANVSDLEALKHSVEVILNKEGFLKTL